MLDGWRSALGATLAMHLMLKRSLAITMRGIAQPYFGVVVELDVAAGYVIIESDTQHSHELERSLIRLDDVSVVNYTDPDEEDGDDEA